MSEESEDVGGAIIIGSMWIAAGISGYWWLYLVVGFLTLNAIININISSYNRGNK